MLWTFTIIGCRLWTPDPTLDQRPYVGHPGQLLQMSGSDLVEPKGVTIRGSDGVMVHVTPEVVEDAVVLELPALPPGDAEIVVRWADRRDVRSLSVVARPDEVPCQRTYVANTGIDRTADLGFVERFYADGRRERIEIALSDVEGIEYMFDAGCAAVWLRKTDGTALLFEDSGRPLVDRARSLAELTNRPLIIR